MLIGTTVALSILPPLRYYFIAIFLASNANDERSVEKLHCVYFDTGKGFRDSFYLHGLTILCTNIVPMRRKPLSYMHACKCTQKYIILYFIKFEGELGTVL